MGMMARMRSLAPAFIITVGALFVLFMVISDSNVLEAIGGRTNNVGSVNGDEISYQEYQQALERQREQTKQQTGNDIPEGEMDQFREQVWEALVTEKLILQEVKRLGLNVSDQEIKDIILGDNPPAFLKQNFIDSLGNFNRALYEEAIFNPQKAGKRQQILYHAERLGHHCLCRRQRRRRGRWVSPRSCPYRRAILSSQARTRNRGRKGLPEAQYRNLRQPDSEHLAGPSPIHGWAGQPQGGRSPPS